jgi:hypothetical protein
MCWQYLSLSRHSLKCLENVWACRDSLKCLDNVWACLGTVWTVLTMSELVSAQSEMSWQCRSLSRHSLKCLDNVWACLGTVWTVLTMSELVPTLSELFWQCLSLSWNSLHWPCPSLSRHILNCFDNVWACLDTVLTVLAMSDPVSTLSELSSHCI